jgi:lysozyme
MSTTLTPGRISALDAVMGVDVSHYQKSVDWAALKAQNIRFAFIKLTDGSQLYEGDSYDLLRRINRAKENGMKIGYYHFARPGNLNPPDQDALAEANFVVNHLTNPILPAPDFPIVLDIERFANTIVWPGQPAAHAPNPPQLDLFVGTFVEALRVKGYATMFYSNPSFLTAYLPAAHSYGLLPMWIAHYVKNPNTMTPKLPRGWKDWAVWQYTQWGRLDGITGYVDIDLMRRSVFGE